MKDIHWAAYIRADNLTPELCDLMVKTGMNYFEIGITSGSKNSYAKCGWAITCEPSCQTAATSKAGFNDLVSVNYSFNVIDERPETIRQTISYHRELERILEPIKLSQPSSSSDCNPIPT